MTSLSTRFSSRNVRVGLAVGALMLVAACGGSGNGYGSSSGGNSSTPASSQAAGPVSTASTSVGMVLTDAAGRSLYAFAADKKGVSNCTGSCLTYWPPVPAGAHPTGSAAVTGTLGSITRSDGSKQLTVNGWPMYTYVGDHAKGDTTGQGTNLSGGLWWVVAPDGTWITGSGSGASGADSSSSYSRGGY